MIQHEYELLVKLQSQCHQASYNAGWWHHPGTGLPYIPGDSVIAGDPNGLNVPWDTIPEHLRKMIVHYWPFVVATKIGLIHSEVSEGLEAHRRGLKDDKLSHRLGLEVELADAMIRQFDIMGAMQRAADLGVVDPDTHRMNIGEGLFEKMAFNKVRPDHKIAARTATGGKAY